MKQKLLFSLTALLLGGTTLLAGNTDTEARILKWPDGKAAAFYLSFDDGCVSQLDHAIPLLQRHKLCGTFYIMYGTGIYPPNKSRWLALLDVPSVTFGNHTLHHGGVKNAAELDAEIAGAQQVIAELYAGRKHPGLVSFAIPGGVPWQVTTNEVAAALARYGLIERLDFFGPPIQLKTLPEINAYIDKILRDGALGHFDFHGVGGDWLAVDLDIFTAIVKRLDAERERLWNAPAIACQKYAAQRDAATLVVTSRTDNQIELTLSCTLDPARYDLPLSVEVTLPADWTSCRVTSGNQPTTTVRPTNGRIRFSVHPGRILVQKNPI